MTHVDVSSFASKTNLASLKTEVDKLDIDKLTPVPNDLAKLSNVVKNDVVKKTEHNKLVTKVGNIDITGFVLKTKYDTDKSNLAKKISDVDKKIPETNGLVKKTDYISKIPEIEGKIPNITGSATNSALTTVENKVLIVSSLVKKQTTTQKLVNLKKKIIDHNHGKYISTPEFNNLAAGVFDEKLTRANLVTKTDFNIKLKKISHRVTLNKTKHLPVETELKKIKYF